MAISKCSFRHLQNSTSKDYDKFPVKLKLLPHKYKSHTQHYWIKVILYLTDRRWNPELDLQRWRPWAKFTLLL